MKQPDGCTKTAQLVSHRVSTSAFYLAVHTSLSSRRNLKVRAKASLLTTASSDPYARKP